MTLTCPPREPTNRFTARHRDLDQVPQQARNLRAARPPDGGPPVHPARSQVQTGACRRVHREGDGQLPPPATVGPHRWLAGRRARLDPRGVRRPLLHRVLDREHCSKLQLAHDELLAEEPSRTDVRPATPGALGGQIARPRSTRPPPGTRPAAHALHRASAGCRGPAWRRASSLASRCERKRPCSIASPRFSACLGFPARRPSPRGWAPGRGSRRRPRGPAPPPGAPR